MLISFSGRKAAGKTLLANQFIEDGYQKISFADRLRELLSTIYSLPIEDLSDPLKKEVPLKNSLIWGLDQAMELSKLTGLDVSLLFYEEQFFQTYRDAMQYIGTEVLRRAKHSFHTDALKEKIKPGQNYVLDDVRFKNELDLLIELDALCFFIIRPYYSNYSNHISERELNRSMFDKIIVNDRDKTWAKLLLEEALQGKFTIPDYDPCKANVFLSINEESAYWAGVLSGAGRIIDNKLCFATNNKYLIFNLKNFLNIKTIEQNGFNFSFALRCPYLIEDLKMWNFANSDNRIKVPEILEHQELIDCWTSGLVDGSNLFDHEINLQNDVVSYGAIEELYPFVAETNGSKRFFEEVYSGIRKDSCAIY